MRNIFKVCISAILVGILSIILIHLYKYQVKNLEFVITQQDLDHIKGSYLYMNADPLIITLIEDDTLKYNIDTYSLNTALTIQQTYTTINLTDNYASHKSEICLIRPHQDTTITLINPKFVCYFKSVRSDANLKYYELEKENYTQVNSVDIVLHKHNILCIPRFWLFKIPNNVEVSSYFTHNIFTKFFSLFIL